jgi:hypothetical protein
VVAKKTAKMEQGMLTLKRFNVTYAGTVATDFLDTGGEGFSTRPPERKSNIEAKP